MTDTPFRPADDEARATAARLLDAAQSAALGTLAEDGAPMVTRIAVARTDQALAGLVSDLAPHAANLRARPACSLLLGEPPAKGDPLTGPRLTLIARAAFVPRDDPARPALRAAFLALRPKAALYIDFADFHLLRFTVTAAHLNAGFGKAYRLAPEDLG